MQMLPKMKLKMKGIIKEKILYDTEMYRFILKFGKINLQLYHLNVQRRCFFLPIILRS